MQTRNSDHAAWPDLLLGVGILLATVLYLAAMPRDLGMSDEGVFLLEAKRVQQGGAMYRDIFWIAMPLAHWVMALSFASFGVQMLTARLTMATLHGLTALVLFFAGRRIGVRRSLALAAPTAYLALCQAPWPYASPHWFSTFFMATLLLVALGQAPVPRRGRLFVCGLLTGGLASVHQQKGAAIAAAMCALYACDVLLDRRYGGTGSWRELFRRLMYYGLGIAAVVIPVVLTMIAQAGVAPLIDELVVLPLTGYRAWNSSGWAQVNPLTLDHANYTWPWLLKYLPVVVVVGIGRAAWWLVQKRDPRGVRDLLAISAICSGATLAIAYLPDFIHVAFIAPLFLVFAGETIEAGVRFLEHRGHSRVWGCVASALLLFALGTKLTMNMRRGHREYPIRQHTAFGGIDLWSPEQAQMIDRMASLLDAAPSRELFAYPVYASLQLMVDARTPTSHLLPLAGYLTPAMVAQVLEQLENRKPTYAVVCDIFYTKGDPIDVYLRSHYTEVVLEGKICPLFPGLAFPGRIVRRSA